MLHEQSLKNRLDDSDECDDDAEFQGTKAKPKLTAAAVRIQNISQIQVSTGMDSVRDLILLLVDAFQGAEKEVILISTSRTEAKGNEWK